MKSYIHIAIISLLLCSCQKEQLVNEEIPHKPKVVSAIFLAAGDSQATAVLTLSQPVISSGRTYEPSYFGDATVKLQGPSTVTTLMYDTNSKVYQGPLPWHIEPLQQYKINVSSAYGEINGSTIVPPALTTSFDAKLDSSANSETGFRDYILTVNCKLTDVRAGHIRLLPIMVYADSSRYPMLNYLDNTPVVKASPSSTFTKKFNSIAGFPFGPVRIDLLVMHCDEHYARYVNATSGLILSEGLPGSEPNITYSNMSNRIGIIGSYNASTTTLLKF